MPNKMDYGLHFCKYPKDKAFLFQRKFYSNMIMKQRKKIFGTEFNKITLKLKKRL